MPKKRIASESVHAFYVKTLNCQPEDDSLKELPTNSPCGDDCVKAILAAAGLLAHHRAAFGDSRSETVHQIIAATDSIITCYWRG